MKKMIVAAILVIAIGISSAAHAAVFSFEGYGATVLDGRSVTLFDGDLSATFTGFSFVSSSGLIWDFGEGEEDNIATITFDNFDAQDAVVSFAPFFQEFEWMPLKDSCPTKDYFNSIVFSIQGGDTLAISSVEVSPTPIPGAVWLLGSGLIGLVGVRRKMQS